VQGHAHSASRLGVPPVWAGRRSDSGARNAGHTRMVLRVLAQTQSHEAELECASATAHLWTVHGVKLCASAPRINPRCSSSFFPCGLRSDRWRPLYSTTKNYQLPREPAAVHPLPGRAATQNKYPQPQNPGGPRCRTSQIILTVQLSRKPKKSLPLDFTFVSGERPGGWSESAGCKAA